MSEMHTIYIFAWCMRINPFANGGVVCSLYAGAMKLGTTAFMDGG